MFETEDSTWTELELVDGMNSLVGPNNSGKSNIMRAIALAIDPSIAFDPSVDPPSHMMWAKPRLELRFQTESRQAVDKTLLKYLAEYERSVSQVKKTYAEDGQLRLNVVFGTDGRRQESFSAKGAGARPGDPDLLAKATKQFRKAIRLVYVKSGQSLEDLLEGQFREILRAVIAEHLKDELAAAQKAREEYVRALQAELLEPLRTRVFEGAADLVPEIRAAALVPSVPDVDGTLARIGVRLEDTADTALAGKGTGLRSIVLVAMLRYLADRSRRSMVFAVEEPESFLHPAAQEGLSRDLSQLAVRSDVTLLVTTHSPFMVSHEPHSQVVSVVKDGSGRTRIAGRASGDDARAPAMGGLFRQAGLAHVLEAARRVPATARGIVVVEGSTDERFLRTAATRAGRPELVADIHIVSSSGASDAVARTLVLESHADVPILTLLDNDEPGRSAKKDLNATFKCAGGRRVLTYGDSAVFPGGMPLCEAEDLFPSEVLECFVAAYGEDAVLTGKRRRKDRAWHFDFNQAGKELLPDWIEQNLTADNCGRWVALLERVRDLLDLST